MGIFKEIQNIVSIMDAVDLKTINEMYSVLGEMNDMDGPGVRLGIGTQRGTNKQPARKGDIVLRVEVNGTLTPFVISNVNGDTPLARNSKLGEEISIRPEMLVIGAMTKHPKYKAAAGRMATKYPDRKVFLYGDTKAKKEPQPAGEATRATAGSGNANPRMR